MIKPIIYNIKELRKPCLDVLHGEDVSQIMTDLCDTLYPLVGKAYALAANQIGYNKKIALIRIPLNNEHTKFNEYFIINPKIVFKERKILFTEGCLSLPGLSIQTDRYVFITIEYLNEKMELHTSMAQDLESLVLQHEIDHLFGRTLLDRKHRNKK